jgi:DNA repair exonuclease SbcCD ATPase subunit
MKIAKVYIKNFRGYGECNINNGMYMFEQLDSSEVVILSGYNGFGKTGFFEAIEWCITGKIKGLQEIDIYDKNTMKKSPYLKFQSTNVIKEREVMVSVIFDNDWGITRKTFCNSLDENGYNDTAMDINGHIISQTLIDEKILQCVGQLSEQIFKLSFNGQSRNTDFVKSTKAKNRTSALLEFMGLKLIDDIVKESDSQKRRKLKSKYTQVNKQLKKVIEEIKKIDLIFKNNKWGSIETYIELVGELLENISSLFYEMNLFGICERIELSYDDMNKLMDSLDVVRIEKEKLVRQNVSIENNIADIVKRRLQKEWNQIQQLLNSAQLVKKLNLKDLEYDKERLSILQDIYRKSIDELQEIKQNSHLVASISSILKSDNIIGITKEEKEYYKTYINAYNSLQIIGEKFALIGNYENVKYDIDREFGRAKKYESYIKKIENVISMQKQQINEIEGVYAEQKNLLIQVQSFVNEQDEISSCPVCGGVEFINEKKNGKDELLKLISTKIADGNSALKEKNDKLIILEERLKKIREKVRLYIRTNYYTNMNMLETELSRMNDCISKECDSRISCNEQSFGKCGTRLTIISSQINKIQNFNNKYQSCNLNIEEIILKKESQKSKIEEFLRIKFNIFELQNYNELGEKTNDEHIRPLLRKKNMIIKAMDALDKIVQYDVGIENRNLLRQYEAKCEYRNQLEAQVSLFEEAIDFRSIINEKSKILEYNLLKTLVENNKVINWVYNKINPHPYFREVSLKIINEETGILSAEDNNIYLDHIFSEAQMNVLSLSIFLGLILSIKNYNFGQIYLDDPVQSLDDINVISFIDLIRALLKADKVHKSYIISTHDHNFSKLLKIKLRNYRFVEYKFVSYGEEGPRIKKNISSDIIV